MLTAVRRWPRFAEELTGRSSNSGAWRLEQWRLALMGLSSSLFRREESESGGSTPSFFDPLEDLNRGNRFSHHHRSNTRSVLPNIIGSLERGPPFTHQPCRDRERKEVGFPGGQ
ncbi:hypothetical protein V6N13_048660 [Hibiscus sabdariffa]|uniref:Uncharacterized protein n=1 Tax=Hibiscus sabdariffa TaxID=183260 RepID=A0ABR2DJ05_9ROSI